MVRCALSRSLFCFLSNHLDIVPFRQSFDLFIIKDPGLVQKDHQPCPSIKHANALDVA